MWQRNPISKGEEVHLHRNLSSVYIRFLIETSAWKFKINKTAYTVDIPISEKLRERIFHVIIDGVSGFFDRFKGGKRCAKTIRRLRNDSDYLRRLEIAFRTATKGFVIEYSKHDVQLTTQLSSGIEFFENSKVREALLNLLNRSEHTGTSGAELDFVSFGEVFPGIEKERIRDALKSFMPRLLKEVWELPEFRAVFQTALARESLKISGSQLQILEKISKSMDRHLAFKTSAVPPESEKLSLLTPNISCSTESGNDCSAKTELPTGFLDDLRLASEGVFSPILSEELERLGNASPREMDIVLATRIEEFIKVYHRLGDPTIVYEAALGLAKACEQQHADRKSYQLARLHSFLGYLLINADPDLKSIRVARQHLEKAVNMLDNAGFFDSEVLRSFLRASWLLAVAIKIEGDYDTAMEVLNKRMDDRYIKNRARIEDTIPLIRQRVIMEGSRLSYNKLRELIPALHGNEIEYFHSLRRIFEHALNMQEVATADEMYCCCEKAFKRAKKSLDKVYVYTYKKNVYHYLMLKGDSLNAQRLLRRILKETQELRLVGQHRQVEELARMFDSGPRTQVRLKSAVYIGEPIA